MQRPSFLAAMTVVLVAALLHGIILAVLEQVTLEPERARVTTLPAFSVTLRTRWPRFRPLPIGFAVQRPAPLPLVPLIDTVQPDVKPVQPPRPGVTSPHLWHTGCGQGLETQDMFSAYTQCRFPSPLERRAVASLGCALDWFGRHQQENGSWSTTALSSKCRPPWDRCPVETASAADVEVTGLVLLTYLAAGVTHNSGSDGERRRAVRRALRWLKKRQDEAGQFGTGRDTAGLRGHAIATLAIGDLLHLSRNFMSRRATTSAIELCLTPEYLTASSDAELAGWAWLALRKARQLTALRQISIDAARLDAAIERVAPHVPEPIDGVLEVVPVVATLLHDGAKDHSWRRPGQMQELLETQRPEGCLEGSWDPSRFGGRIVTTAVHALTLSIPVTARNGTRNH